ncbi:MAG: 5-hydroxyisourate hydrolase [Chthoniobacter sp.]|jgi:5-hydroxyisourate hydrolase|nr:5-hydroxyisourate hydrolase [Chthoniobacter sp.]
MSAKLTTHILDLTHGKPAADVTIELRNLTTGAWLKSVRTNTDGRTDTPLLVGDEVEANDYELLFHIGDYFHDKSFLDIVPIRFRISDPNAGHHVPLLCTPWAYSTYRGS